MKLLVLALMLVVGVALFATLVAVLQREGIFDRIIGVGVVGTKATVLIAMTGFLFDRLDAFVDIAIAYALLNFIVTLAVAKYFTRREVVP